MRSARGFTLMELLVTLIITALAVTLMFQVLASFNHSRERTAAVEGVRDNDLVMAGWIGDTIRGIVAVNPASMRSSKAGNPELGLTGDADGFTAMTVSPLEGEPGIPTVIRWRVAAGANGTVLAYAEAGGHEVALPLGRSFQFAYLDSHGTLHAQWPPAQGLQDALPDAIELTYTRDGRTQVLAAAIAAPVPRVLGPYSLDILP